MTIGDRLLCRLNELNIRHVFGVPGDYNLQFLEQLICFGKLAWVGNCNELNAAYAADGYARLAGISALVVTHGVGSLSAINGIAGAYCERVPVICIAGSPPLSVLQRRLLVHHTLADGNYDNVLDCYRNFTVAQSRLTPANAASEMDRVLAACWREKRPVYLELPSDISHLQIAPPSENLDLAEPVSDGERLATLVELIASRFDDAKRPALLLDTDVDRFKLAPEILSLAEKRQAPFAIVSSGKGVIAENSPLFVGTYVGSRSQPFVRETIEHSDCLLCVGIRSIDSNTGVFTARLPESASIFLHPYSCLVDQSDFQGIHAREVLREVANRISKSSDPFVKPSTKAQAPSSEDKLNQEVFWRHIAGFLQPADVILSDIGTCIVGLGAIKFPEGSSFLAQPVWGSIGYSLPALLGTLLAAPQRRHVLFIGDGSFQLTAQELSTILRHNLKPIVFLLNNDGYTIERAILGPSSSYNDINMWRYSEFPRVFDTGEKAVSCMVRKPDELLSALSHAPDKLLFVEVILDRGDMPKGMAELARAYADLNFGPVGRSEPGP
ncbi:MAG: thiamine pyrophosphate-binding protein [Acidobacteriota bacterium]|nr:thiamine pyrophosphate-binding protein [Acidobacteriota bacterium]